VSGETFSTTKLAPQIRAVRGSMRGWHRRSMASVASPAASPREPQRSQERERAANRLQEPGDASQRNLASKASSRFTTPGFQYETTFYKILHLLHLYFYRNFFYKIQQTVHLYFYRNFFDKIQQTVHLFF
jgi:hypothetical protein